MIKTILKTIWFSLQQIFPHVYYGVYIMNGKKTFIIWKQWFNKVYDVVKVPIK